jgi:hypothetical protein
VPSRTRRGAIFLKAELPMDQNSIRSQLGISLLWFAGSVAIAAALAFLLPLAVAARDHSRLNAGAPTVGIGGHR